MASLAFEKSERQSHAWPWWYDEEYQSQDHRDNDNDDGLVEIHPWNTSSKIRNFKMDKSDSWKNEFFLM